MEFEKYVDSQRCIQNLEEELEQLKKEPTETNVLYSILSSVEDYAAIRVLQFTIIARDKAMLTDEQVLEVLREMGEDLPTAYAKRINL